MRNRIIDFMNIADIVTLLNAISGLLGIYFSFKSKFFIAAWLMVASLIFDWLDGKVARLTKRENPDFGVQMDSLADIVSFGVAPAVFGIMVSEQKVLALIAASFFLSCGMLRLARFNVTTKTVEGYNGMPITTNGLIFPVLYFISPFYFARYGFIVYLLSAILMASSFKVRKVL